MDTEPQLQYILVSNVVLIIRSFLRYCFEEESHVLLHYEDFDATKDDDDLIGGFLLYRAEHEDD